MNSTQVEYCLKKIYNTTHANEVVNTWIDLTKVACVYLDQDANLYPDKKHTMFYFDTSNDMILIKTGRLKGNQFISDTEEPNHMISFTAISGFIQTSKITDVGQFEYGGV